MSLLVFRWFSCSIWLIFRKAFTCGGFSLSSLWWKLRPILVRMSQHHFSFPGIKCRPFPVSSLCLSLSLKQVSRPPPLDRAGFSRFLRLHCWGRIADAYNLPLRISFPLPLLHSGQCVTLNSPLISLIIASHRNGPSQHPPSWPPPPPPCSSASFLCRGSANVRWLLRFWSLLTRKHTRTHSRCVVTFSPALHIIPVYPLSTADVQRGRALCGVHACEPGWCSCLCVGSTLLRSITLMDYDIRS